MDIDFNVVRAYAREAERIADEYIMRDGFVYDSTIIQKLTAAPEATDEKRKPATNDEAKAALRLLLTSKLMEDTTTKLRGRLIQRPILRVLNL